jgi:hypothetical protein
MVSGGLITGAVIVPKWTFAYTGSVQEVKFATTGTYEIELEGASGGHTWTSVGNTSTGGKGGHVLGRYHFGGNVQSPVHLDIRVGGQGAGTATYQNSAFAIITSDTMTEKAGGYNGGGGGGATDVRPHDNSDELTGGADDPRIIVAGGGGGSSEMTGGNAGFALAAGHAGGETGTAGYGKSTNWEYSFPAGGTQTGGFAAGTGQTGISLSAYGGGYAWEGSGGGGAGWWGGEANSTDRYSGASGGGGSSYNGGTTAYPLGGGSNPVLTTPYDPSSPAYVPGSADNNATIAGNVYGNGKATVRWIKGNEE